MMLMMELDCGHKRHRCSLARGSRESFPPTPGQMHKHSGDACDVCLWVWVNVGTHTHTHARRCGFYISARALTLTSAGGTCAGGGDGQMLVQVGR